MKSKEFFFFTDFLFLFPGTDFQCTAHIMPVKNEEGVVMMFILNFEYVQDEGSDSSTEKLSPTSPTKSDLSEYLMCCSSCQICIKNMCCKLGSIKKKKTLNGCHLLWVFLLIKRGCQTQIHSEPNLIFVEKCMAIVHVSK